MQIVYLLQQPARCVIHPSRCLKASQLPPRIVERTNFDVGRGEPQGWFGGAAGEGEETLCILIGHDAESRVRKWRSGRELPATVFHHDLPDQRLAAWERALGRPLLRC